MNEKDGKPNRMSQPSVSNIPTIDSTSISLDLIKEKYKREELTIKDILDNDECMNDLRTNPISQYKEMMTSDNIKIMIDYCLKYNNELNEISKADLRYPYYSSQILCSSCVLLFKQSISNIRHANSLKNYKKNIIGHEMENKVDNEYLDNKDKFNDLSDSLNQNYNRDFHDDDSFNFVKDYENEIDEKYVEAYKNLTETDLQRKTINNKSNIKYSDEDMKIIKEILNHIFDILNCQKEEKIFNENLSYLGYFKNIVNYILINETDIMIEYLFGDSTPIINKFYSHLNNTSIQIILENLLNILSDKEDYNIKYNDIIKKLIQILSEDSNNDSFENSEFICELIINTLVNNTEKQLIDLIINNNNIMIKIKNIIKNITNKKDNEKVLTNILKVLCQINNIILKSLNESLYKKVNSNNIINDYNKMNLFEYQYFCTKKISYKNIFNSFKDNIISYLFISEEIYKSISKDIIYQYKTNNYNQNDNNINNNMERRKFGLHNLYKWKFILSILKIFVYSYNATDKLNNGKYFYDKELFLISINLHFKYPENNIYQNIFLEIMQLICLEECPKYLIESFLIIKEKKKQNEFIFKLLNNIKINKDKKNNLTSGIDIEILNLFYSSNNKAILNHFNNSYLDNKYKNIFKDSIKNKFDRHLNEDYEYTNDEIFDIEKDDDDTFDGEDCEVNREFLCFKNIISNFLDKIEEEKKNFIKNINIKKNNKNHINKMEKRNENEIQKKTITDQSTYTIGSSKYVKKEETKIVQNKDGSISNVELNFSIDEED